MRWVQEVIRDRVPDLLNLPGKVVTKLTNNNIRGRMAHWRRKFSIRLTEVGSKIKQRMQDVGLHFRRLNGREVQVVDALLKGDLGYLKDHKSFTASGDPEKLRNLANNVLKLLENDDFKANVQAISTDADARIQQNEEIRQSRRDMALKATSERNLEVLREERKFVESNPHWTEDWDIHNVVHGHPDVTRGIVHFFKAEAEEKMRQQNPADGYLDRDTYDGIMKGAIYKVITQMNERAETIREELAERIELAKAGKVPLTPKKYDQLRNAAVHKGLDLLQIMHTDDKQRGHFMDVYRVALGIPSTIRDDGDRGGSELHKFWSEIERDGTPISSAAATSNADQNAELEKLQNADVPPVVEGAARQRPVPKPRTKLPEPRRNQ